jgi:hypothetical protein
MAKEAKKQAASGFDISIPYCTQKNPQMSEKSAAEGEIRYFL